MKNEIDWSKAPEGATHWCDESDTDYACWLRRSEDGSWHAMLPSHSAWHVAIVDDDTMRTTTPRPAAWNGEGLPPAGTVCEVEDADGNWHECTVLAHFRTDAVFIPDPDYPYGVYDGLPAERFRPIRTPEQIAAEEREKAIDSMAVVADPSGGAPETCRLFCERLYDACYRKTEGGAQ